MHPDAREKSIGIAAGDHNRSEIIAVEQKLVCFAVTQAFALAAQPEIVGVLVSLVG